ncbi:hypothetical protein H8A87_05035 [Xenorhabdus sp. VLS]|uniref:Transposase n=1 Tax=Xenorhabdus lircayensis TaxID=2763499 RepID=A0ABS0U2H9_9GAMM|nr:hypothetical protein [Xenorhabdus lircayensis]
MDEFHPVSHYQVGMVLQLPSDHTYRNSAKRYPHVATIGVLLMHGVGIRLSH